MRSFYLIFEPALILVKCLCTVAPCELVFLQDKPTVTERAYELSYFPITILHWGMNNVRCSMCFFPCNVDDTCNTYVFDRACSVKMAEYLHWPSSFFFFLKMERDGGVRD